MGKKLLFALASLAALDVSFAVPAAELEQLRAPPKTPKVLVPVVHWKKNRRDPNQLLPTKSGRLYYVEKERKRVKDGKQDPHTSHQFAEMKATFSSPTIMTEDSEFISQVSCKDPDKLSITISDDKAFGFAKRHWRDKGIIFGTYAEGCGAYGTGVRSYWKSSGDPEFSSTGSGGGVAQISVKEVGAQQELESADLEWGSYEAPSTDTNGNVKRAGPPCKPPKSAPNGLAATNWCKAGFDQTLDEQIGFMKLPKASFLPKLEAAARTITRAFPAPLRKRDVCLPGCDESVSVGGPFDYALPKNVQSPWGQAFQMTDLLSESGISLYCVNCHINGNVAFSGSMHIQVTPEVSCDPFPLCETTRSPGIYDMVVRTTGQIDADVNIGMDLKNVHKTFSKQKQLFSYPLSPWSIPDVLSVGPEVTLDIKLDMGLDGTGKMLAGAGGTAGPWDASYSFSSDSASSNGIGFTPRSKFKINGKFDFNTSVTFPVGLGIGIDFPILSGIVDKTHYNMALKDGFGVVVHGNYVSTDQATKQTPCPGGIQWDLRLINQVFFDVFSGEWIHVLNTWESPSLKRGCVGGENNGQPMPEPDPYPRGTAPLQQYKGAANEWVSAAKDGDLYLGTNQTKFNTHGTVLTSDKQDRYFHFYGDEMGRYGVSRLRLSPLGQVPKTAQMVVLQPASSGNNLPFPFPQQYPKLFVAVDSNRNVYYPVLCRIAGQPPKLFLQRQQHAYQALGDPGLIYSVTGGVVQMCQDFYLSTPGLNSNSPFP